MAESRARSLRRVQIARFAMQEAKLYLDVHPEDAEALAYFKRYRELTEKAAAAYEQRFGPLRAENVEDSWNWAANPWPWDYEANV